MKFDVFYQAAVMLGDVLLKRILCGSFDRHSNVCTGMVMYSPELVAELERIGEHRMAKVLEIVGGALVACEAGRTRSLHLLNVLVWRLFGCNTGDVDVRTSMHYEGFPAKQWRDLPANMDA